MIIPNLTEEMVETLCQNADANLDSYRDDNAWMVSFLKKMEYSPDDTHVVVDRMVFDYSHPEKPSSTDFTNAVILYEGTTKTVSDATAASGGFWNAMIHANLEYMRYRWPLEGSDKEQIKTLENRYLMSWEPSRRERERNGLSRLWWIVHLTVSDDPSLPDKYALTREIMSKQDIMANILDRDQFNPKLTKAFAKILLREREAGNPLDRRETRALMKHVFVLDRAIIIQALNEEKITEKLTEYLEWYRSVGIHLEEET